MLAHDPDTGRWQVWRADGAPEPAWIRRLSQGGAGPGGSGVEVGGWTPAVTRDEYLDAVRSALDSIRQGEIYQVNLSQRLTAPVRGDSWDLYRRLRRIHPAPFSAFLPGPQGDLLSFSPELFLRRQGDRIRTDPIKGTRPRDANPSRDARNRAELEASAKDRAELDMIVDLERNDLGRVCRPGTVAVTVTRPDLYEIKVTVSWRGVTGARSFSLNSQFSQQ